MVVLNCVMYHSSFSSLYASAMATDEGISDGDASCQKYMKPYMYQDYSQTSSKNHIQNTQRHFAHHVHGVFLGVQAGSNQILANHYGA